MCCNVLGLGALNILLILQGLFAVVMNALPFSTDCDMAAESFFGQQGYRCNQVEKMLNASWINAYITVGLWMMALGLLPKLSKDFSAQANKLVCLITCVIVSINQVGNAIMSPAPLSIGSYPNVDKYILIGDDITGALRPARN